LEGAGNVAPGFEHRICQTMSSNPIMTIGGISLAATSFAAGSSLAWTKLGFAVGKRSTSPAAIGTTVGTTVAV
jgi:hypothetical protein